MARIIGKPGEGRDLSGGQCGARRKQPRQRETIGHNALSPADIGSATEGQNGAWFGFGAEQCQIARCIACQDARRQFPPIGQARGHFDTAINHVVIGHDPPRRNHKARTGRNRAACCAFTWCQRRRLVARQFRLRAGAGRGGCALSRQGLRLFGGQHCAWALGWRRRRRLLRKGRRARAEPKHKRQQDRMLHGMTLPRAACRGQ